MVTANKIAGVAATIGEPARAAMLTALLDGRALTAAELAGVAGVTPQTVSTYLSRSSSRSRSKDVTAITASQVLSSQGCSKAWGITQPAPVWNGSLRTRDRVTKRCVAPHLLRSPRR
jgi:DNA-binding transcriptional ArsR family regulator